MLQLRNWRKNIRLQPLSGFYRSLDAAYGIWCARCADPKQTGINAVFAAAYNAPFHTDDAFWKDAPLPAPGAALLS